MHEINFTDRSFDKESSSNYSVSVQANTGGLTYCVFDNSSRNYILFRKHRFEQVILPGDLLRNVQDVLQSDDTLGLSFGDARFMGYTRQTALVPAAYYDPDLANSFLKFINAGESEGVVFSSFFPGHGIYNVFSLPEELVSLISNHFRKVTFLNQTTSFLGSLFREPSALLKSTVYLGLNHDFFDIACTGEGKLLLYNTFQYVNETDLLYYVLFVYNKMLFDASKVPLVISGEFSSKLSYTDILRQYIAEVVCDPVNGIPDLGSGLKQLGTSRYLNLLNVQLCELSVEYTGEER